MLSQYDSYRYGHVNTEGVHCKHSHLGILHGQRRPSVLVRSLCLEAA